MAFSLSQRHLLDRRQLLDWHPPHLHPHPCLVRPTLCTSLLSPQFTPVQPLTAAVTEALVLTFHCGSASWTPWKLSTPLKRIQASQQANELTKQANETSDRVLKLEEEQFKMEIRPFFLVTDWGVCKTVPAEFEDKHRTIAYQVGTDTDRTDNRVVLILELTNTTQSYEMVRYSNAISSNGKRWGLCVSDRNGISLGIPAGESRKFCFYSDESFFSDIEGKTVSFEFVLENRFDERYKESFDLVVIRFNWERKDCNISPQKYEIQAFTKDCGLVPG